MRHIVKLALILAAVEATGFAQWVSYPTPGIPRTADGKPNLTAPAPRAPEGTPDLTGLWQIEPTPWTEMKPLVGNLNDLFAPGDDLMEFSKYAINILGDFKPQEAPMRPEGVAAFRRVQSGQVPRRNPCLAQGFPFVYLIPAPSKFIQTPQLLAIVHEDRINFRQIYMDGRPFPADPQPLWMGYSVGKWNGDTLVVDTIGFNDKNPLDAMGHPHSEALHITERYSRRDFGHLEVQVTIDDPKMYTRPFSIKYTEVLQPDTDILEYACEENEKDAQHLAKQ